ncbi:MAG: hypothetical protein H7Y18_06385 [Clostridiaceae bacterium]|nr:hypothetical protein [Clostridiaceae bacterium]
MKKSKFTHKRKLQLILSFCLIFISCLTLPVKETEGAVTPATIRILYVGNSMIYFCDMPAKIQSILQSVGYTVEYQQVTPGGYYLSQHAQPGSAARLAIQNGCNGYKWDYIIVNGNTMEPADNYNAMLAATKTLKTDTDTYNLGAKFILHSTNPYSPSKISLNSNGVYTDTNVMAKDISDKYASISATLGVKYGPNTKGIQKFYSDGVKAEGDIWNADGKHHTEFSHYMAACIYSAMISSVDPTYFTQNCSLSQSDADYAKNVAKVVINNSNQGIVLGEVPSTNSLNSVKIEAENMTLTNYTIESNSSATNGSLIKVNKSTIGTATKVFIGVSGKYDVKVTYWDESDGASSYNLYFADNLKSSWVANEASGSSSCDSSTRRTKTISNVDINKSDLVKITSNYNGDEYGRIDIIEFIPKVISIKIEAETMTLTNYTVESNSSATNGSLIKVNQNTTGTAAKAFTGVPGKYDVKVTYWDESDGASSYNLYLGDNLKSSWVANEVSGSIYCDSSTRRTKTISNVDINQSNLVKITSNYNGDEYGRIDVIEFTPVQ